MKIVYNFNFFVCAIILLRCYANGESTEDKKAEKEDKSDASDEKHSLGEEVDVITPKMPEDDKNLPEDDKEENNEASAKSKLEESSSAEKGEDEIAEDVEESLTEDEKTSEPVELLNLLFEKIETEVSSVESLDFETKNPFELEINKDEIFQLLFKYYEMLGKSSISEETFNKLWKQKEKKYGKKFVFIVEKLLLTLQELVKEEEEKAAVKEPQMTEIPKLLEKVLQEMEEETTTGASPTTEQNIPKEMEKEKAPKDTFAVWNSEEKICLLAKFQANITINYSAEAVEEKVQVTAPNSAHFKGKCESSHQSPMLQLSWQTFVLTLMFNKTSEETWSLAAVELLYDSSEKIFDGATNRGKITARSKNLSLFETPFGKSYFCPWHETVLLYSGKKQVASVKLSKIHLQPYEVEDGKFAEKYHCTQVFLDGIDPFIVNETIPLAVGSTLALITLLILVGFSIYRAYHAAKVDYNSME